MWVGILQFFLFAQAAFETSCLFCAIVLLLSYFIRIPVEDNPLLGVQQPAGIVQAMPSNPDIMYVATAKDLEAIIHEMHPHFEGKESEANWAIREKSVLKLKKITQGNAPQEFSTNFLAGIKGLLDGILKVVNSLRTTVSANGCQLIQDIAKVCGAGLDNMVEILLQNLIKLCANTKKIAAANANTTVNTIMANVSFHHRLLQHIHNASQDKNVQPRTFVCGWLKTIISKNRHTRNVMEHAGGLDLIEKCIKSGLTDRDKNVRDSMRPTYWAFARLWPKQSEIIMSTLEKKQQDLLVEDSANPNPQKALPASTTGTTTTTLKSKSTNTATRPSVKDAIAAQKRAKAAADNKQYDLPGTTADPDPVPKQSVGPTPNLKHSQGPVPTPKHNVPPSSTIKQPVEFRPTLSKSVGGMSSAPLRPKRKVPPKEPVSKVPTPRKENIAPSISPRKDNNSRGASPSKPSNSLPTDPPNSSTPLAHSPPKILSPLTTNTTKQNVRGATPSKPVSRVSTPIKVFEDPPSNSPTLEHLIESKHKLLNEEETPEDYHQNWALVEQFERERKKRPAEYIENPRDARKLLASAISRIRSQSMDVHGFRKLQTLIREPGDSIWEDGYQFQELILPLLEYLETPTGEDTTLPGKAQDLKTQILLSIRLLFEHQREHFSAYYSLTLCSMITARNNHDNTSHLSAGIEDLAETLVAYCDTAPCIDSVLDILDADRREMTMAMGCYVLTGLVHKEHFPGEDEMLLQGVRGTRLAELANRLMDDTNPVIRRAVVELVLELHDSVDDWWFWEIVVEKPEHRALVTYYLARHKANHRHNSAPYHRI